MKEELEFAFSESTKMLENGKRVILGNTKTGEWVKISKESYHILKRAIDEKYTMKEFIQIFQSDDDRCYMKELLEKFEDINLITHKKMEQKFAPKFITFAVTNKCRIIAEEFCNITELPERYDSTVINLAFYLYRNQDVLGYSQKSEGEKSVSLISSGIPDYIMDALPKPKVVIGGA